MLPVNINQFLRQFLTDSGTYRLSVDLADTAVFLDSPADGNDPVILRIKIQFFHFLPDSRPVRLKDQFHQRILCTVANQIFFCLGSQCQTDASDDQGFTCSGLTGENVQIRAEGDLRFVDQSQIFHM